MYAVINQRNCESEDSRHEDFDDALLAAEKLAEMYAAEDAGENEPTDVSTYENGDNPRKGPGNWEAGACPQGDDGAYWPYVEWVEE